MSCVDAYMTPEQEARFWSHIDKSGECWLWTGTCNPHGYGQFSAHYPGHHPVRRAHRAAWELTHGPIPQGMGVLHKCDVRSCCNPAHLFLGTHRDNMADMATKGRAPQGERRYNARLTAEVVRYIRQIPAKEISYSALAYEYGVSEYTIADIRRRQPRNWRRTLEGQL